MILWSFELPNSPYYQRCAIYNQKSVDIRAIKENGETLSIDVKAVHGYSSLVVNNVEPKENHFLVFVIYNNKFEDLDSHPDVFIVPSQKICEPLVSTFKKEKRIIKGKLAEYKDKWNLTKMRNKRL